MMHYELYISDWDFIRLQNHAEKNLPVEAVALLFGIISGNIVHANRVVLMENESTSSKTAFSINPENEYKLLIESEERGESLVGIFHSHPAPPEPSKADLRNMKLNPVIWLIASKLTGNWIIKGYALKNEKAIEISIKNQNPIDSNS